MIENLIQIGEPIEHRGIVIAPLFPRRDPAVEYLTLDERWSGTSSRPRGRDVRELPDGGELRSVPSPRAGLGEDVRLHGEHVIGSGPELAGEVIQLSAFTSETGGSRAFGRIARPSTRR